MLPFLCIFQRREVRAPIYSCIYYLYISIKFSCFSREKGEIQATMNHGMLVLMFTNYWALFLHVGLTCWFIYIILMTIKQWRLKTTKCWYKYVWYSKNRYQNRIQPFSLTHPNWFLFQGDIKSHHWEPWNASGRCWRGFFAFCGKSQKYIPTIYEWCHITIYGNKDNPDTSFRCHKLCSSVFPTT